MPKNKRPVPRKSAVPPQEDDDVLAQQLADLALAVAAGEGEGEGEGEGDNGADAATAARDLELARLVRNAMRKKNDDVLYGAIERARYSDALAYRLLRERIEEAAGTVTLRRDSGPEMEIDAFALPVFVHSTGGLKEADGFNDGEAFDALVASIKQGGLESPDATVVMISHAYDLDEVDAITYSHLNDMVRDAAGSMTEKKLVARPALERSMSGWAATHFGPADTAVELRFLLGFAMKRVDDPFYAAPEDDAAADAYFEARMARYRAWTVQAGPLVKRCLARDPAALELHFLYQDLFYGAKEQGVAELAMLQMISDVNAALEEGGVAAAEVRAVIGPAAVEDEVVMRVNLSDPAGVLLASLEKPLDVAADLQGELDDVCDALAALGIVSMWVAARFGEDGQPLEATLYQA
ncbi:hypothetical protein HF313_18305 [Massilia atriviolacea]|uniref:DUF2863 family protein n=1 Tax=Massilia atriviolacea TaxID=2495579 RepID=A0A430HTP8_9BURK|nr:hypothetical protein [Massilia atriviolacea]RSZ60764.1 hypothetical protein EJB06_01085 [Massilia atriviolacea]